MRTHIVFLFCLFINFFTLAAPVGTFYAGDEWVPQDIRTVEVVVENLKAYNTASEKVCKKGNCFRMHVILNGSIFATFITSPGKVHANGRGTRTREGFFKPTFLSEDHKSSLYDNAPMPNAVFYDGHIAIHGSFGTVDGEPQSHGCLRLKVEDSKLLFNWIKRAGIKNTTITVKDTQS